MTTLNPPPNAFTCHDYAKLRLRKLREFQRDYVAIPVDEKLHSQFVDYDDVLERRDERQPIRRYETIESVQAAHAKFILLGDPGAGKSTLLRRVEMAQLEQFIAGTNPILPLWIDLGVSDNPSLPEELLAAWWRRHNITDDMRTQVINGGLLLLLDGLNEMPGEQEQRAKALDEYILRYDLPAILTCRVANYRDGLRIGKPKETGERHIAEVRIPPLDKTRVENFAHKQLHSKAAAFLEAVYGAGGSAERRALAANPYALTMMLTLWDDPKFAFPNTREQLYDTYIKYLYRENQKRPEPVRAKTPFDLLKARLQKLAYQMLLNRGSTTVKREWAEENAGDDGVPGATIIADVVNLHLMIESEKIDDKPTEVRFFHQSLYEHLALPLIDLENGSQKARLGLIRTLGNLGAAAKIALPKLVAEYSAALAVEDSDGDDRAAAALGAAAEIAWAVTRRQSSDAASRRIALRLILGGFGAWTVSVIVLLDRALARALDLTLALDRALALARDLALDRALALARALALDRALDRALALARDLALALARDHALDRALALARDLARDLALALARDLALDRALALARDHAPDRARDLLRVFALWLDFDPELAVADPQAFYDHCHKVMREAAEALSRVESMA